MWFVRGLTLVLGLGIALAACSGGSSTPGGMNCQGTGTVPPQLLYPVPGASPVADDIGLLIYQGYAGSPNSISLFDGVLAHVATTPTALPSPLPSPIATPSLPNGTTYAVTFPLLASGKIYQVLYALPAGCNPANAQFGSFATL